MLLAVNSGTAKAVKEIRDLALSAGFREITKWNLSSVLGSMKDGSSILVDGKWSLTETGLNAVASLVGATPKNKAKAGIAHDLRAEVKKLTDPQISAFVFEAIEAHESDLYRSAVVLSWVGAIAILQDHVVAKHLGAFNTEAVSRNPKWKHAKTRDDLGLMKEADFLDILSKLSIIGKNVKKELVQCLDRRNGCGHPNSLKIGSNTVAHHIEILLLNVYQKF